MNTTMEFSHDDAQQPADTRQQINPKPQVSVHWVRSHVLINGLAEGNIFGLATEQSIIVILSLIMTKNEANSTKRDDCNRQQGRSSLVNDELLYRRATPLT